MEDLELSELLELLSNDTTDQSTKRNAINIVLKNFQEKPLIRYNRSIKNLEETKRQELKVVIESARKCALNIIMEFGDFNLINTISQVESISSNQIHVAKNLMTINSFRKD